MEHLQRLTGQNVQRLAGHDAASRWEALNLSQQRATLAEIVQAVIVKPAASTSPIFNPVRVEIVSR